MISAMGCREKTCWVAGRGGRSAEQRSALAPRRVGPLANANIRPRWQLRVKPELGSALLCPAENAIGWVVGHGDLRPHVQRVGLCPAARRDPPGGVLGSVSWAFMFALILQLRDFVFSPNCKLFLFFLRFRGNIRPTSAGWHQVSCSMSAQCCSRVG